MRPTKATPHHACAPGEWRHVPDWTGDYDFDAAILRNSNSDLRSKIQMYIADNSGYGYGPKTGYNGYGGGDD